MHYIITGQFAMSHGLFDLNLGSEILILGGDIRSRSWPNIGDSYGTRFTHGAIVQFLQAFCTNLKNILGSVQLVNIHYKPAYNSYNSYRASHRSCPWFKINKNAKKGSPRLGTTSVGRTVHPSIRGRVHCTKSFVEINPFFSSIKKKFLTLFYATKYF